MKLYTISVWKLLGHEEPCYNWIFVITGSTTPFWYGQSLQKLGTLTINVKLLILAMEYHFRKLSNHGGPPINHRWCRNLQNEVGLRHKAWVYSNSKSFPTQSPMDRAGAVSYTHLTLPTICSV